MSFVTDMRCFGRAFWGGLFLFLGAISPTFALSAVGPALLEVVPANPDVALGEYRFELAGTGLNSALNLSDATTSPLFTADSLPDANVGNDSGASEWDYLWRNASRIPITSIPEPTSASLLFGGAIVLLAQRSRRPTK